MLNSNLPDHDNRQPETGMGTEREYAADLLRHHPAYISFRHRNFRHGLVMVFFMVILMLGLIWDRPGSAAGTVAVTVIMAVCALAGGDSFINAVKFPENVIYGTVTEISKTSRLSGITADRNDSGSAAMRHFNDWKYLVKDNAGNEILAVRLESFMSETRHLKPDDVPAGMHAAAYTMIHRSYCVLLPDIPADRDIEREGDI